MLTKSFILASSPYSMKQLRHSLSAFSKETQAAILQELKDLKKSEAAFIESEADLLNQLVAALNTSDEDRIQACRNSIKSVVVGADKIEAYRNLCDAIAGSIQAVTDMQDKFLLESSLPALAAVLRT